ncbi:methylation-associated defense system restriction endonuclease subunit S MAD5 [Streptomyces gibsoniae]|uniref:Restriction endonuclease subunit S n=1 Tax=Streptomyces gibsoniae TaxID=3075529 RepID=A0ABU2U6X8_9ACTN|nr:restriction endonuclease subunit S [Streptomyces sp. DSM 41699]MDT0468732.1 restriction endonuclease subunit S [Streptomyces sp. DSM 41699]
MKIASDKNPVMSGWLAEQGLRMDASPYLSGALEARKLLEKLPVEKNRLREVTTGHDGGIFNGPQFSRTYLTSPDHAVPFLGSTDMMEADFSFLPLLAKTIANRLPYLEIQPGMTLVSCSGTIGRMAYARPDMKGIWSSQHVMKIEPDEAVIPSGYLYTFLRSPYGVPMIASSAYGAIIQHIEPHHIADLPVPRFADALEQKIHKLVEEAARLRAAYQAGVRAATEDFFKSVGLPELNDLRWHEQARDLGFEVVEVTAASLRAMNHASRAMQIKEALTSVEHSSLGQICAEGRLATGPMFKRIDSDLNHGGCLLVGQRQGWWTRPEDARVISRASTPDDCFMADETVLVAAQGLPAEYGLFGRAILVTGSWLPYAYSQHFLRIKSSSPEVPGAYLYAFLRSEAAMRLFRSMLAGSGPQSIHALLLTEFPIPIAPPTDRERIAETVRQAYRNRDQADKLEDEALTLLIKAIEEAAA